MPVEESSNFLIMFAAIADRQAGQVDYLTPYRPVLESWVDYINQSLPDPGEQLCTDDFEGPSPHNANLALKGILGLASYAILLRYFGEEATADMWDAQAKKLAVDWISLAADPVGEPFHYKQRYDQNNTWSDKYNLIWQYIFNTQTFPDAVRLTENKFYKTKYVTYGVPLDNRHTYQKCDWYSWMGALSFDDLEWQLNVTNSLYNFAHTSPSRVPFTDLYDTANNMAASSGFIARAVMGGLYALPLTNIAQNGNLAGKKASSERFVPLMNVAKAFDFSHLPIHKQGPSRAS